MSKCPPICPIYKCSSDVPNTLGHLLALPRIVTTLLLSTFAGHSPKLSTSYKPHILPSLQRKLMMVANRSFRSPWQPYIQAEATPSMLNWLDTASKQPTSLSCADLYSSMISFHLHFTFPSLTLLLGGYLKNCRAIRWSLPIAAPFPSLCMLSYSPSTYQIIFTLLQMFVQRPYFSLSCRLLASRQSQPSNL